MTGLENPHNSGRGPHNGPCSWGRNVKKWGFLNLAPHMFWVVVRLSTFVIWIQHSLACLILPTLQVCVCVCVCVCVGDGAQLSLSGGSAGKESTCQCRRCKRHGFDPWVRKIPWRRKWQPAPVFLQILENSLDRGTWRATVHGSQSWLQPSAHTHMHLANVPQDSTRM